MRHNGDGIIDEVALERALAGDGAVYRRLTMQEYYELLDRLVAMREVRPRSFTTPRAVGHEEDWLTTLGGLLNIPTLREIVARHARRQRAAA